MTPLRPPVCRFSSRTSATLLPGSLSARWPNGDSSGTTNECWTMRAPKVAPIASHNSPPPALLPLEQACSVLRELWEVQVERRRGDQDVRGLEARETATPDRGLLARAGRTAPHRARRRCAARGRRVGDVLPVPPLHRCTGLPGESARSASGVQPAVAPRRMSARASSHTPASPFPASSGRSSRQASSWRRSSMSARTAARKAVLSAIALSCRIRSPEAIRQARTNPWAHGPAES